MEIELPRHAKRRMLPYKLVSYEKYFDTFSKNLRSTIYNFIKIPNRKFPFKDSSDLWG